MKARLMALSEMVHNSYCQPSRLRWNEGGLGMNVIEETIEAMLDSNGQLRLTQPAAAAARPRASHDSCRRGRLGKCAAWRT